MATQIIDDFTGKVISPADRHEYSFILAEGKDAGKKVTLDLSGESYEWLTSEVLTRISPKQSHVEEVLAAARGILATKRARPRQYINSALIEKLEESQGSPVRVARRVRESHLYWLRTQAKELGLSLHYTAVGYITSDKSKNRLVDLWAEVESR